MNWKWNGKVGWLVAGVFDFEFFEKNEDDGDEEMLERSWKS